MSFLQPTGMCATMAGRIEVYVHSDAVTENKGACIVRVACETDFGARTDGFKAFAKKVAQFAYGAGAETWDDVIETRAFPSLEGERRKLESDIGERVTVEEIVILYVDPPREPKPQPPLSRKVRTLENVSDAEKLLREYED